MPVVKSSTVLEIAKNLRVFLNLYASLTRNEVLNYERKFEQAQNRLARMQRRLSERNLKLTQMRGLLAEKDQQVAALQASLDDAQDIVDRFHKLYYDAAATGGTWKNTFWFGVPAWKCPLDLWVYQEIVFELRPDVIIECGTASGGSALYLACICDLVDKGRITTIDIEDHQTRPQHERIQYIHGSSTSQEIVDKVKRSIADDDKVLVILDSDHSKDHVLSELGIYSQLVTKGSYLIVEDTNINGHPVLPEAGPGPMEAVQEFVEASQDFVVDSTKEKLYMTFNPNGFLRKVG